MTANHLLVPSSFDDIGQFKDSWLMSINVEDLGSVLKNLNDTEKRKVACVFEPIHRRQHGQDHLEAISVSPSQPAIAWKKTSCSVNPLKYKFSTKTLNLG
jgi:hypothetical protein